MWHVSSPQTLQPKYTEPSHWVQSVCVCLCSDCMAMLCELVLVSCSPSLSLSISRMISLTWAPQGLVILVISSTRRSIVAASGRPNNAEKEEKKPYSHDPPPCSHHRRMRRSEQKAGHKQANEWCERFAQALKMDEENMLKKNREMETLHILHICIKHASVGLWVTEAGSFLSELWAAAEAN